MMNQKTVTVMLILTTMKQERRHTAIKLLRVPNDNDVKVTTKNNNKQQHSETSLIISQSQFASFPKQKMIVRSVVVLLGFKTRHVIIEECMPSLMTQTVLGLDSKKTKLNRLRTRLHSTLEEPLISTPISQNGTSRTPRMP
jgi:hypothetical protein